MTEVTATAAEDAQWKRQDKQARREVDEGAHVFLVQQLHEHL